MRARLSLAFLFAAIVMAAQSPDASRQADQLRDQAKHAKEAGDLQSEANDLCLAATIDAKKYTAKCDKAKSFVSTALAQFQADINMGRTALQQKDYAGASRNLSNVTFGPNKAEAQVLLQQARIGTGDATVDQVSMAALQAVRTAYAKGDFDAIELQAKNVLAPSMQAALKQILTNIAVYGQTMKQAAAMTQSGNFKGAEQKYQFAVLIEKNGPGSPQDRLREAQAAAAQHEKDHPAPPPIQQAQTKAPSQQEPVQPPKTNEAAKITGYIQAGQRAETQGDLKSAMHNYLSALRLDGRQAEAIAGTKRVRQAMQGDPKVLESSLTDGVTAFYASHFAQADNSIGTYLQGGGKQYAGAAHFYLAASLLSQALLVPPDDQGQAAMLRGKAQQEFVVARNLHYVPLESVVSPKILAQWTEISEYP